MGLMMRGTHFAELSAFVAVAEQASFTKAARRLGRSTATLSQTVRALEDHLGVRLLNRTTRSVAPTDAGERLLAQVRPLLNGFEAAVESVNEFPDRQVRAAGDRGLFSVLSKPAAELGGAACVHRFSAIGFQNTAKPSSLSA
jgi:DNA-binding transcriptional LysR family regulator